MPGSALCSAINTGGNSQVAATWLAVTRTVPVVASRLPVRLRDNCSAAACICRAASAIASAAAVGTTPRPVRSNSGVPSCSSSSATWRLSVGCCACS